MLFNEPIAIEGFYATRVIARRAIRFTVVTLLIAAGLALAVAVVGVTAFDLFLVSWGLS